MSTVGDLVQDVRRELFGMQRPEYNLLDSGTDASQTIVHLGLDSSTVSPGSLISIDDELMYVWAITGTALTVRRAMLGSKAAVHAGDSLVEVNPMFPDVTIRDALEDEIKGWAPKVAAIDTVALQAPANARDLDLAGVPPNFVEILEVLRSPRSTQTSWIPVGWRVQRHMDPADFPSGSALFLDTEGEKDIDVRVTYMAPYVTTTFTNDTTVDVVGLEDTQLDIAKLGALWRLVTSREVKRNFIEAQGDPRSAQEVPPGAIANSGRVLKALRDERLREEMMRIRSMYPPRRR